MQETREICKNLNIEDVNETKLNKKQFKRLMKTATEAKNKQICDKLAEGKDKCSKIKEEEYGKKAYISEKKISDVRHWFRTRYRMQPFAANYSGDRKYAKTGWLCKCMQKKESDEHLRNDACSIHGDIRAKYGSLAEDKELVEFFKEILSKREQMEETTTAAGPVVQASSLGGQASLGPGGQLTVSTFEI